MEKWPYPNIPPELFEVLTEDEPHILEALTRTYLDRIDQRKQRPPTPDD